MATFDIQGALDAGYSREEIDEYMRKNGYSADVGSYAQEPSRTAPGVKPEDPNELGWGEALWEGVKNIPASAGRLAGNLADAVMNPVDTAEAIWKTGAGAATKAARLVNPDLPRQDEERYAEAVGQYVADRYGSPEGWKRTIAYDPVGLFSDASTVFTGGAGLAKGAAALGKGARAVGAAVSPAISAEAGPLVRAMEVTGRGLSSAARATDPLGLTLRAPSAVSDAAGFVRGKLGWEPLYTGGPYEAMARKMYRTALGLNTGFSNNSKARFSPEQVQAIVDTGLSEGLPITNGGHARAMEKIGDLNTRIDNAIAEAEAAGIKVDPYKVAEDALNSDARRWLAAASTPIDDLNAFDNAVNEYRTVHGRDNSTISGMQETKKATYRAHENRYRNNASSRSNGAVEADMELARQQRLEIGRAVDEAHKQGAISDKDWTSLHDLNRKEGNLMDVRDAFERALLKSGNKSGVDWFTGAMAAMMSGDPSTGIAVGAGKQLLTSPWFRSQAALKLHNMGELGLPSTAWTPAMAAQYAAARDRAVQDWYRQWYNDNSPTRGLIDLIAADK